MMFIFPKNYGTKSFLWKKIGIDYMVQIDVHNIGMIFEKKRAASYVGKRVSES